MRSTELSGTLARISSQSPNKIWLRYSMLKAFTCRTLFHSGNIAIILENVKLANYANDKKRLFSHDAIAAVLLGQVERLVGASDQVGNAAHIRRHFGHANACSDEQRAG